MTCEEARGAFTDLYDGTLSGPPLVAHDELGNPVVAYTNIRTSTTGGGNTGHVHWRVCR